MNQLEEIIGIKYSDLTKEEKAAVDRIKDSYYDLSLREKDGSHTDVIMDLSVAIVKELRGFYDRGYEDCANEKDIFDDHPLVGRECGD